MRAELENFINDRSIVKFGQSSNLFRLDAPYYIVTNPAALCPRWKSLLFMKHSRPQVPNKQQINPHEDKMSWTKDVTREAIVARISDPEHLRFIWLRNPYSRLLSGFLDKGVGGSGNYNVHKLNMDNYGAPFEPTPSEFLRFVKALLSMRADGAHINKHFSPQAEQCGLQHGMQYDFHLKVEDIHVWYPDLIALFGLEDTVSSGWSFLVSPPPPSPPSFRIFA